MESRIRGTSCRPVIGIVGDKLGAGDMLQSATEGALNHVAEPLPFEWVPTPEIQEDPERRLSRYAGLLISCSTRPYASVAGALLAIRYGREKGVPVLGTCGGFQHIVLEFVRDVLGFADAEHAEADPSARRLALTPLSCSFVGQKQPVRLLPGSMLADLHHAETVVEPFFCNYGINPEYRVMIESHGLTVCALGDDGIVRAMALKGHPFFVGTLYVPQARSEPGNPHPLVAAFVAAARRHAMAMV